MKELQYLCRKFAWRFLKCNRQIVNDLFVRGGVKLGSNCRINSNILTSESYLIEIGDNVTISDHVSFVTHDNSISKIISGKSDVYGRIKVGNNCFIGAHSILMYGITLADDIIVASGSVVTKSFSESRVIIGGNPAKVISTWDKFAEKCEDKAISLSSLKSEDKRNILLQRESDRLLITR